MSMDQPESPLLDVRRSGSWFIHLSDLSPVAGGAESDVFVRPGKPSQLVKVHHARHIDALASSKALKDRIRRWRGIGPHKTLLRQNRAYLEATLRGAELGRPPPLAHLRGVMLTDLGLGVVVQKIRDRNGDLAPNLFQLGQRGAIDAGVIEALTRFAHEMSVFRIIGNDLNAGNLVYETRHGRSRIVLIEGYGTRNLIPLRRWSKRINDRSLSRRLATLAESLELDWDEKNWAFSRTGATARKRDV